MRDISREILDRVRREEDFKLAPLTTYGLGGKCKEIWFPESEEEAAAVFTYLKESGEKFAVLGNGSNVLISDGFYDSSVISTSELKGIELFGDELICLAGTTVSELMTFCKERGLSGLEFLAGIPATVGGLAFMNGGAFGNFVGDRITSVALQDLKLRNFTNKMCDFGYKHSTMRDIDCIILSVAFKIDRSTTEEVKAKIDAIINKRRAQPKGKSCGSVFKNPQGFSAGRLIEECGLKGFSVGGARVSEAHANFIINEGGTALDVYNLISLIKRKVREIKRVDLEEEVVYIGEFNDTFG